MAGIDFEDVRLHPARDPSDHPVPKGAGRFEERLDRDLVLVEGLVDGESK